MIHVTIEMILAIEIEIVVVVETRPATDVNHVMILETVAEEENPEMTGIDFILFFVNSLIVDLVI